MFPATTELSEAYRKIYVAQVLCRGPVAPGTPRATSPDASVEAARPLLRLPERLRPLVMVVGAKGAAVRPAKS